jgi:hypothetical protein
MRRSIGVMTALIAVLVDTGAGLGQPVIQSERQTIPMAVEKRGVGHTGARQALGPVELRSTAPSSIWPRTAIPGTWRSHVCTVTRAD